MDDKIENKSEELGGKAKEGLGKATDDEQLEAEGKTDQAGANLGLSLTVDQGNHPRS